MMERNPVHKSNRRCCHSNSSRGCSAAALFHPWLGRRTGRQAVLKIDRFMGTAIVTCGRRAALSLHARQASSSPGAELQGSAQRELAAFYAAVSEMYGPEEATRAALDWIEALEKMDPVSGGTSLDWRQTTIAAAGCLASRVVNRSANRRRTDCPPSPAE
jgi:hypothetical protein